MNYSGLHGWIVNLLISDGLKSQDWIHFLDDDLTCHITSTKPWCNDQKWLKKPTKKQSQSHQIPNPRKPQLQSPYTQRYSISPAGDSRGFVAPWSVIHIQQQHQPVTSPSADGDLPQQQHLGLQKAVIISIPDVRGNSNRTLRSHVWTSLLWCDEMHKFSLFSTDLIVTTCASDIF